MGVDLVLMLSESVHRRSTA